MKLFCENIDAIPALETIKDLTREEHLVLEFPRDEIDSKDEVQLIAQLKEQLPENYTVFKSGVWESTLTITIISLVSEITIKQHVEEVKQAIKDYLELSRILLNDYQTNELRDWELVEEHGEHNRYENRKNGQILETCSYPITSFESIDPYFFGLFIKTSAHYPELKKMIKSEFHDTQKIMDFLEGKEELKCIFQ
ncbi:MAG: hypothetical protein MI810_01060 [Flavobacteriales bacterium]|nr:hypothetical protein [Flavobacteriales bacterium]